MDQHQSPGFPPASIPASLRPGGPPDHRIKRKPVSNPNLAKAAVEEVEQENLNRPSTSHTSHPISSRLQAPSFDIPPVPCRPSLTAGASSSAVPDGPDDSNKLAPRLAASRAATDTPSTVETGPSPIQKAYAETRHFLGGLINHPTESNRHYTILRHSNGIVFYRGSTTSVTVSIFSDTSLPATRTLWLQSRGWTGNTGMRAKALFRVNDDWLNVTPSIALRADQADPVNERAWQRDIAKFRKKAPAKIRDRHQLRETIMARIPVEAGDGYFQVVLCDGPKKHVLCNSPVFRLLSTSLDPSSLRGASLSTLPLELGAMALSTYAQYMGRRVLTPVAATMQNRVQASASKKTAAGTAVSLSDVGNHAKAFLKQQPGSENAPGYQWLQPPDDLEQGPLSPFPMNFKARGEIHAGASQDDQEPPILNITKLPDKILDQLHGYFACWTRFAQPTDKENQKQKSTKIIWYQSVLCIRTIDTSNLVRVDISHVAKRTIMLRFLDDIQFSVQGGSIKLDIRVMCFIRPEIPPKPILPHDTAEASAVAGAATEASILSTQYDTSYTQMILSHPAWLTESNPNSKSGLLDKTKEGYETALGQIQKTPLHWIGVRSETAVQMDRRVLVSGFYILR